MHIESLKIRTLKPLPLVTILIQLSSCLLLALQVGAAEYGITPSIRLRETYDDKIFFKNESDFEHLISPSLDVAAATERAEVQASASLDITRYKDNTDLNTVEQYYQFLVGGEPGPRLKLYFTGTYVLDYTFEEVLEEEGIVADRNKRKRASGSPSATFVLDPRNRLQLIYNINNTQYEARDRRDYLTQALVLGWTHDLKNERTSLDFGVGGSKADFKESDDSDIDWIRQYTLRGMAGVEHRLTETKTLRLRAGARYTHSKDHDDVTGDSDTNKDASFLGNAELRWRLSERASVSAELAREYRPSSLGEEATRDSVGLGLNYRLTEFLRFDLDGSYRRSKTDGVENSTTRGRYSASSGLSYLLARNTRLRLSYNYTKAERDGGDTDQRNRVFLELRWIMHTTEWSVREPRELVRWPHR